jgi:hypothetical protein
MKDFETYIESKNPELYQEVFGIGKKKIVGDVDNTQAKNIVKAQGDYVTRWVAKGLEDNLNIAITNFLRSEKASDTKISLDVNTSFEEGPVIYTTIKWKREGHEGQDYDAHGNPLSGFYHCRINLSYKGNWAAKNLPNLLGGNIKEVSVSIDGNQDEVTKKYDLSKKDVIREIISMIIKFIAGDIVKPVKTYGLGGIRVWQNAYHFASFLGNELKVPPPPAGAGG